MAPLFAIAGLALAMLNLGAVESVSTVTVAVAELPISIGGGDGNHLRAIVLGGDINSSRTGVRHRGGLGFHRTVAVTNRRTVAVTSSRTVAVGSRRTVAVGSGRTVAVGSRTVAVSRGCAVAVTSHRTVAVGSRRSGFRRRGENRQWNHSVADCGGRPRRP